MVEPTDDWTGYDERFLGVPLPLPLPLVLPIGHGPVQTLGYPRFSVRLDRSRRFAVVTGVNIDGGTLQDLARRGDWELDPRVADAAQTGAAVYADNDLDRGHLVRRRDPGWGTAAQAMAATEATFFYPNAAPQAAGFNQSKMLWLGLEDHVLRFADAADLRVSVFTAPVLSPDDPPYRGILIPRRFWKVAAWSSPDGTAPDGMTPDGTAAPVLAAAGFVLDQSELIDADSARAVAPLGGFRTFQVPIGDIEQLARVDLGALVDADVFTPEPAQATRPAAWKPLDAPSDIVLG